MARGWKTFGLNLATNVIGIVIAALGEFPFAGEVPQWVGFVISGLSTTNMVLRAMTTTPIFQGSTSSES